MKIAKLFIAVLTAAAISGQTPKTYVYDFNGMDVRIQSSWWNPDGQMSVPPATRAEELQQEFRASLMKNCNLKIDEYGGLGGWGDWPQMVENYCKKGGRENYIFIVDGRSVASGIKKGLFYDWSKSTDIDWNNKKWNPSVRERGTRGNSFYVVSAEPSEPRTGVFFNKRLLKEAGINPDSIYDMQKNGTWTWDAFEQMLWKVTRDTNNDDRIDVWGVACNTSYLATCSVLTNGAQMVYKDEKGNYVNGFGDPKVTEAMEWAQKIFNFYFMPEPKNVSWDWFFTAFVEGNTVFCIEQEYNVDSTFRDMKDDWGFVCFPYGPHGEKKYKNMSNDWGIVIPAIYGDAKCAKIAKAYDLFTETAPGLADDAWKEGYYSKFRDTRAVDETLQYMRDSCAVDLVEDIQDLILWDYFWDVVSGIATPQESYEKTKAQFDALIQAAN